MSKYLKKQYIAAAMIFAVALGGYHALTAFGVKLDGNDWVIYGLVFGWIAAAMAHAVEDEE